METTVVQFNRNVEYWEARQWPFLHHHLEALLNRWEEFLRYVSAHNARSKYVAITGLSGSDAIIYLTKLT